jgi:hypothetical protein
VLILDFNDDDSAEFLQEKQGVGLSVVYLVAVVISEPHIGQVMKDSVSCEEPLMDPALIDHPLPLARRSA